MKRHNFLVERINALATNSELPEAERKRLHHRYSDLYWAAVGVPPDFGDVLRSSMESIVEHGDRMVDDVINELRHRIYSSPLPSEF